MDGYDRNRGPLVGRRGLLAGAGAGMVAVTLADLLDPARALAQAPAPRRGGALVYCNTAQNTKAGDAANGLHPYHWVDINTRTCWNMLTYVDENLEVQPDLAVSWEADDAQAVWEFRLREGVKFHDGRDLTADDVVASFRLHLEESSFAREIKGVEKAGPDRVRFLLTQGNSEFHYVVAEYRQVIMAAGPPDRMGMDGNGTGPFRPVRLDPKRRLIMERNEHYFEKGFPYLDRLELVNRTGDMGGAMNGFRAGQFDVVLGVDPGLIAQIEKMPDTEMETARSGGQMMMILPKHEGSPLLDRRVRKALSLAIDREAINRIVYRGRGWIGNDTHMDASDPAFLPLPGRDVAAARRLLAEAGHANGITLPTFYFAPYWAEVPRVFQVVAESVKEAGITLPIQQMPNDGYRAWRVEDAAKTRKHRFAFGPVGPRNPGISLYRLRPDYNESGYWSGPDQERYMELFRKAMVTGDTERRRAIYRDMQRIAQEDGAVILLGGRKELAIRKPGVHGLVNHPQHWAVHFTGVWKS
ncbi:MAG: ABC transporter substrate-binding protein [Alphaproteobacteria bacterium]